MTDITSKRDSSAAAADLKQKLDEIITFYKQDKSLGIPQTSETMEKLVQLRQVKKQPINEFLTLILGDLLHRI